MIETDHDVDRPDASTQADVTLVSRGITVTACVERSDEFGLVVRPSGTARAWADAVKPGDPVEVYWVSGYEERTLPARVTSIDEAERPGWHLQPTGPAERTSAARPSVPRRSHPSSCPGRRGRRHARRPRRGRVDRRPGHQAVDPRHPVHPGLRA